MLHNKNIFQSCLLSYLDLLERGHDGLSVVECISLRDDTGHQPVVELRDKAYTRLLITNWIRVNQTLVLISWIVSRVCDP